MQFAAPVVKGLPPASQPLLNWKLRQFNTHRREFDPKSLRDDTEPAPPVPGKPRYPGLHQDAAPRWAALMAIARADDKDLVVPAAERARYEASFARFASVFPDVFYVSEGGRYFPDDSDDKGRFLGAGYHNVMGYWRDDLPLMELVLDQKAQKELDWLWMGSISSPITQRAPGSNSISIRVVPWMAKETRREGQGPTTGRLTIRP